MRTLRCARHEELDVILKSFPWLHLLTFPAAAVTFVPQVWRREISAPRGLTAAWHMCILGKRMGSGHPSGQGAGLPEAAPE